MKIMFIHGFQMKEKIFLHVSYFLGKYFFDFSGKFRNPRWPPEVT
jgi:hypothetical protein